jgi:pyrimidine operon attenuation protein/uracil phosphoribosyltransferase
MLIAVARSMAAAADADSVDFTAKTVALFDDVRFSDHTVRAVLNPLSA